MEHRSPSGHLGNFPTQPYCRTVTMEDRDGMDYAQKPKEDR